MMIPSVAAIWVVGGRHSLFDPMREDHTMNSMNRHLWIAACGLTLLGLPSAAQAHGQFLQGINDTVASELGEPACALPMVACGLCHEPKVGDRLENVVVGFDDINPDVRNGPLFDSLVMDAGWNLLPHADDMNVHRDMNLALLVDEALPTMLADELDSDMDGVPDLVELALGYNPLLAYEADDPQRSQLCDSAEPFPEEVGDTDTTGGGDTDTTGGGDTGTTGGETDTTGGDETGTTGGDETGSTDGGTTDATTGSGESTSDSGATSVGSTAADDVSTDSDTTGGAQDEEGCGCSSTGSGRSGGAMGLLGLLGLSLLRRRR